MDKVIDFTDCHGDIWAEMGKEMLGHHNLRWGDSVGYLTLQKAILNDYWADARSDSLRQWDLEKINMVMSKLYYCWVKLLEDEEARRNEKSS